MAEPKKSTGAFAPTEAQILKELKQREQRKSYMNTPKATANRKKYQEKKKADAAAFRAWEKEHPDQVAAIKARHGLK